MPTRAPTACTTPGCPHTNPCPTHPGNRWATGTPGRRKPAGASAQAERILRRDGYRCRSCGAPAVSDDHVQALALGGTNDDSNHQALCLACHRRKTARDAALGRQLRRP